MYLVCRLYIDLDASNNYGWNLTILSAAHLVQAGR
jgi:hypothetical protein